MIYKIFFILFILLSPIKAYSGFDVMKGSITFSDGSVMHSTTQFKSSGYTGDNLGSHSANKDLELNNYKVIYDEGDSFTYYDYEKDWLRHFYNGIEIYRIEGGE